jgi:hypothetical protein
MSEAKELRRKEYANRKPDGTHDVGKPIEPKEVNGEWHSARKLPKATRLSDSKILKGHVEKRDE